jgi:hypothetical protein
MRSNRCLRRVACCLWLAACGGGSGPQNVQTARPPPRLFDPLSYQSLPGPERAFGVREGLLRSYFYRERPLVVNVLARSGSSPYLITRFSGSDRGIGVWFLPAPADTELYAGAAPDAEPLALGGGLLAVRRDEGQHALYGVRGTLESNATRLSTELVLLGRARTLRDHAEGVCVEDATRFSELRNERFELDDERSALRINADGSDGQPSLELLLMGIRGTRIALHERDGTARPSCPPASDTGQPVVELTNDAGIEIQFVALASDEPRSPDEASPSVAPTNGR